MIARVSAIGLLVVSLAVSNASTAWSGSDESCRTPSLDPEYFVYPDIRGPFVVCDWDEDGLPDIVTLNSRTQATREQCRFSEVAPQTGGKPPA